MCSSWLWCVGNLDCVLVGSGLLSRFLVGSAMAAMMNDDG